MSATVPSSPADEIIPADGRDYLRPGEVAHVARNVVSTAVEPLYAQVHLMMSGWRRIFGDGEESGLPVELRSKGLIREMKDEACAFQEELRAWKADDDTARRTMAEELAAQRALDMKERATIIANQELLKAEVETLRVDFEKEKDASHRMRWVIGFFVRWITTKEDKLTVAILKVGGLVTVFVSSGIGFYHGAGWAAKLAWKHLSR